MASMTDYMVLSDGSFEIDSAVGGSPDQKTLTFNLPSDFTVGTNLAKPILAYILNRRTDDGSFGIWVNPELPLLQSKRVQTLAWKKGDHSDYGLWEAIPGTMFKAGQNKVVFAMQPGDKGRALLRGVVLWYQRGSGG